MIHEVQDGGRLQGRSEIQGKTKDVPFSYFSRGCRSASNLFAFSVVHALSLTSIWYTVRSVSTLESCEHTQNSESALSAVSAVVETLRPLTVYANFARAIRVDVIDRFG